MADTAIDQRDRGFRGSGSGSGSGFSLEELDGAREIGDRLGTSRRAGQRDGAVQNRLAERGVDANRLGVVANRLIVLPVEAVHARAIGECVRRPRLEREHAREVLDGLVEVLLRPVNRAAIGKCLRERRVDADGLRRNPGARDRNPAA